MYKGLRLERLRSFPERETKQCSWGTVSRVIPGLSLLGCHSSLPPLQPRARTWPLLALTSSPAWPIILPPTYIHKVRSTLQTTYLIKGIFVFSFLIYRWQTESQPPPSTLSHCLSIHLHGPGLPSAAFHLQLCAFCHFPAPSSQAQLLCAPLLQVSALVTATGIRGASHQWFASMGPC